MSILSPFFEGCFSCERLKDYKPGCLTSRKSYSYCLINTAPLSQSRGHFFSLVHDGEKKQIYLFDPLGSDWGDPNVNLYLSKMTKDYRFNVIPSFQATQHIMSLACSYHCMAFILEHQSKPRGYPESFFEHFMYPPVLKNDEIAIDLIMKYISNI